MPTSQGVIELLAEVVIEGATLQLKDVAIYPEGAARLDVGAREVMTLARRLMGEARLSGFRELRLTGVRYSGARPGREVDLRLDLTR